MSTEPPALIDGSAVAIAHRLEQFGASPAVVTAHGEIISYRELAARADAYAAELGSSSLVLVEAANEIEPLCAYLGALRARKPVILAAAGADHTRIISTFRPDAHFARRDEAWSLEQTTRDAPRPHPSLSVLLSTSGTTGATKLVRLSAGAVQANAESIAEYLAIGAVDRAATSLPFHYSYGLSVVNSHLLKGASLLLTDRSVVDPEFWHAFEHQHANSLAGVPYTYELLERMDFRDRTPESLRTLTQAGGRLPPALVTTYASWARERGVRFFVMYGQTEATARMAYLPPDLAASHPESIGIAIPGGSFRLIDADGKTIDRPDTVGELVYSGPNVMMGYGQSAEDLARGPELTELHTGDLASRDQDGLYRIAGRKSRFAKIYGLRISLDEVEAELEQAGGSGVAVSDDEAVYIALTGQADPGAVSHRLAERYKLPDVVFQAHLYDDLPTLPSGKIDYQTLLRQGQERATRGDAAAHLSNPIEAAFAHAFPRGVVRPTDTFVSLAGDSLNYVTLSLEVERALGFLPEGWEQLTVAQLCGLSTQDQTKRWWRLRDIETEVLIRALAVLGVVVNHASDVVIGGGAEVLLVLAGYNLARYQKPRLEAGRGFEFAWSFFKRIIAPYYVLMIFYLGVKQALDVPSLLLISNFWGRYDSLIEPYWFLEAMIQCLVLIALATLVPGVRRWVARDPWDFGLGFMAVAIVLRVAAFMVFDHGELGNRTPDAVLYLMALGWCMQEATTRNRRLIVTAITAILATLGVVKTVVWSGYPHPADYSHAIWLVACGVGLLWAPRTPIPSLAHGALGNIAAASFYIYLTHVAPVWFLYWYLGVKNLTANMVAAVLVGLTAWWCIGRVRELGAPIRLSGR